MPKHFVFIIGTRAQLIKVAPVVVECERQKLPCTLLMTGQHLETMQDLLDEFGIRSPQLPALQAQEHSTVRALIRWLPSAYRGIFTQLRNIGESSKNIDILVHGDTLSTVIGAMAGRRFGGRVVHMESGLTSHRLWDPFPEEISRRIVFRLAHVAMCPNAETAGYMRRYYKRCQAIDTQGNTILDAVSLVGVSKKKSQSKNPYLVASLHRFQNIYDGQRLGKLVSLLESIAEKYVINFVLHPATRKKLERADLLGKLENISNIKLTPRLGYGEFLRLASGAACVLTDGGSNQEELAALGVPTIIMRKATERSDGLGTNVIMENDVPGGVKEFVLSKRFLELVVPPKAINNSPSLTIVNFLKQEVIGT